MDFSCFNLLRQKLGKDVRREDHELHSDDSLILGLFNIIFQLSGQCDIIWYNDL
jgi:hypothetical protein